MQDIKQLGKCYRKLGKFRLYNPTGEYFEVWSVYKNDGVEVGTFRGYLNDRTNFEFVVFDLEYEDKQALKELELEFGVKP